MANSVGKSSILFNNCDLWSLFFKQGLHQISDSDFTTYETVIQYIVILKG